MEFKNPPPEKITAKANKHNAFTLSEVLITLVIIGVVAAITVPTLMHQYRWKQYRTGLMKARSTLDQGVLRYVFENGENPECGYTSIATSPHTTADCRKLYNSFKTSLNVIKTCTSNAFSQGCIPEYAGIDTIHKANNPAASDEDAIQATNGCHGFLKEHIKSGAAMVLADGMIIFPYEYFNAPIMAVDVNGEKGPNKWGYDVHTFIMRISETDSQPHFDAGYFGCDLVEKGGIRSYTLLYGKDYV